MDSSIIILLVTSLSTFITIYSYLLIARILLTWFQTAEWAQQIIGFLGPITDPYLNIFRSFIPPLGGFDLSPILALIALSFIGRMIGQFLVGSASLAGFAL